MNTVLDVNKMICLFTGESIKLPRTMTKIFEVNDLAVASPETVSRRGMVYMEPVHLGFAPLIQTWQQAFADTYSTKLAKILSPTSMKFCNAITPAYREDLSEAPGLDTLDNQLVQRQPASCGSASSTSITQPSLLLPLQPAALSYSN